MRFSVSLRRIAAHERNAVSVGHAMVESSEPPLPVPSLDIGEQEREKRHCSPFICVRSLMISIAFRICWVLQILLNYGETLLDGRMLRHVSLADYEVAAPGNRAHWDNHA